MSQQDELVVGRIKNGKLFASFRSKENASTKLLLVARDTVLSESVVEGSPNASGFSDLTFQIPADVVSDGVILLEIKRTLTDEALGSATIIAGQPLEYDLHSEVAALRAELDMLKSAFRAQARKTVR